MRVTTMDRYEPPPGRAVEFVPSPAARHAAAGSPAVPVPPSVNQRFHLATAEHTPAGAGHWLACAFDLPPGPVDLDALRAAFEAWGRRHETLRSGFRGKGTEPERYVVAASAYELVARDAGTYPSGGAVREWLTRRLGATCRPLSWPSYLFAVVVRPGGGTVFCGFDHCNADAYSLAVAVREIREGYAEAKAAGAGSGAGALTGAISTGLGSPPATGSFVDYCAEEAEQASAARSVDAGDPRVRGWAEFFAGCGGTTPAFPLPLGVPPGARAPQGTDTRPLLGADAADAFEARCRAAGGSGFTGVLTAVALAARRLGGGDVLRLCTPLHTRYEARWTHAVGWFTTVAPLTLDLTGVRGIEDGVPAARDAFRAARTLAEVPFAQVLPVLGGAGGAFRRTRDDVFMVSYIDYRRLPGSEHHRAANAHHISSVTTADDAQFWFSRTHEGLFLRSRFPAVPAAATVVGGFADAVGRTLAGHRS
ncbi:condensation domain-containing protein [Streptomyces sp. NPDC127033]|uniref:condensation domain-containing protein n=1 Tax=Streptomyces sp. NPDC127033 TaxID=3347110 RepID=UPI00364D4C20